MTPVVEELAIEFAGKVTIGKLDVDVNQDLAIRYGVMGIPTLGLFRDGKLADRLVGYPGGASPIRAWIQRNLPAEPAPARSQNGAVAHVPIEPEPKAASEAAVSEAGAA
jgi:thioredoxin-like negative regulator of GroEL